MIEYLYHEDRFLGAMGEYSLWGYRIEKSFHTLPGFTLVDITYYIK